VCVCVCAHNYNNVQEILFAEIQRGSAEGRRIHDMVESNQIIPISTHLNLIRNIVAAAGPKHKFLIDGFPKALDQARAFEEQVARVSEIVFLDVDGETAKQRSLQSKGASEHQVAKQLARFASQTEQVINHYAKLGLCRTVDAKASLEVRTSWLVCVRARVHVRAGVVVLCACACALALLCVCAHIAARAPCDEG
jgi:adenylate kinase family enzyme